jgi:hypothetical protein
MNKTYILNYYYKICIILLLPNFLSSCKWKSNDIKNRSNEYKIKPKNEFIICDIDINKTINMRFRDIENRYNEDTKVDSEVSVIFIRKNMKTDSNRLDTCINLDIDFIFGPIDNDSVFTKFKEVCPNTIVFYGSINRKANLNCKNKVISELEKNLFSDSLSISVIKRIKTEILESTSKNSSSISIQFDNPNLQMAVFYIGIRDDNTIYYKYIFSKTKEAYPGV